MIEIIVASGNKHKITEIKHILNELDVNVKSVYEITNEYDEPLENGETFEDNAYIKAAAIRNLFPNCYVLADDSGLMVEALNGDPGVHSARYAGEQHNDADNNALLIKNMSNVAEDKRSAKFVSVLCLIEPDGKVNNFRGECEGKIIYEKRGDNGFGYDPYFLPNGEVKTFAEMLEEDKNMISHRKKALEKLMAYLKENI
ncbi:MAG: XTP/dITP diphosphatase [Ezakiella sp.]|nr:XTP/dITP diphosphatase [Ezakiella sp.]MDD7471503.1 XTP/dITP diphosphatase [Bacillota bacterium]MDY3923705.1 XTP/dITP diphosphatase [Ezakiella sp.]